MMVVRRKERIESLACYVGRKVAWVFAIVAAGFALMYVCDDAATAIAVGTCYLIAIGAIIVVMLADGYERMLIRRLRGNPNHRRGRMSGHGDGS
jgi:hypothetical protein